MRNVRWVMLVLCLTFLNLPVTADEGDVPVAPALEEGQVSFFRTDGVVDLFDSNCPAGQSYDNYLPAANDSAIFSNSGSQTEYGVVAGHCI